MYAAATVTKPDGYYNLGVYAQTDKDYSSAIDYFQKTLALDNEHYPAMLELARMHIEGWGMKKDIPKGVAIMKKVANNASGRVKAIAETNLGYFYLHGLGVPESKDRARAYLQNAAKAGIDAAESMLKQIDINHTKDH